MKNEFKVIMKFSNEPKSEVIKQILIETFVKMYNEAVNILNNKYEEWNEEYSYIHPEQTGCIDENEYDKFIVIKQNEIISSINEKYSNVNDVMILKTDVEHECQLYGYSEDLKTEIEFYIKPM